MVKVKAEAEHTWTYLSKARSECLLTAECLFFSRHGSFKGREDLRQMRHSFNSRKHVFLSPGNF